MDKLLRLLGWYRQMNAARALVGVIFAIAHKIRATPPQATSAQATSSQVTFSHVTSSQATPSQTTPSQSTNGSTALSGNSNHADAIVSENGAVEMDDVMDMELDDIATIQAFNNRFDIDS